jgi:hypothetical protein
MAAKEAARFTAVVVLPTPLLVGYGDDFTHIGFLPDFLSFSF